MLRSVVVGATGLVGREIVSALRGRSEVRVLVRRSGAFDKPIVESVFDFEDDAAYANLAKDPPDLFFCALGTTRKVAGSDAAFLKVDRDYPIRFISALKDSPSTCFALVTSVGAEGGRGLYLGAKKAVEAALIESGLPSVIARPSFLKGNREEFRLGERIGLATLAPVLSGLGHLSRGWKRFAPIEARDVASALVNAAFDAHGAGGHTVLEGESLFAQAR
jgi:uncharacterized protein YbjT (DUF2867 family)